MSPLTYKTLQAPSESFWYAWDRFRACTDTRNRALPCGVFAQSLRLARFHPLNFGDRYCRCVLRKKRAERQNSLCLLDSRVLEIFNPCSGADYRYGRTQLSDELDEFCLDDRTVLSSADFPVNEGM
jgi:hypothetical protein